MTANKQAEANLPGRSLRERPNIDMDPIADRKRVAELPQVRDIFGYNASVAQDAAELAGRRYEYALEQRDKLNERIRFGSLTLNAAALVAIASLIGNDGKIVMLGLSGAEILWPVILFGIGLALGAAAIWSNGVHFISLAAEAFKFRIDAVHRNALFHERISQRTEDSVTEELAKDAQPAPDFAYSNLTIWLTNFSGVFWLVGLVTIIGGLAWGLKS